MSGRRGIALIAALWALLLLTAIGSTVALVARERVWFAGGHDQRAAGRWAAEAAVSVAEARLAAWTAGLAALPEAGSLGSPALDSASAAQRRVWLEALNALDRLLPAGAEQALPNGARYRTELRDAAARLNLNAAEEPELRAFFSRWVLDERELSILVQSLLDWRDADDLERAQGAEADYYSRLPTPRAVRNAPLTSERELLLVRGMTDDLFARIQPFIAVLPLTELRINVNGAPAEVLSAVPGFTPELAERLVARRLRGPIVTPAEIVSDPDLGPLFDRGGGARALGVIALYPEVVELAAFGRGAGEGPPHRIVALYALRDASVERLERRESAP